MDLRQAGDMVHAEATRLDPGAPAADKIRTLALLSLRFERLVPAFRERPELLVEDFRDLEQAYEQARVQVDRSGSEEIALRFQWIQMLMAKMAMYFGDESLAQTDFTPGAVLPRGETRYTAEGMAGLAAEVHILSNQVALRSNRGTPQAKAAWERLAAAAQAFRQGTGSDIDSAFARLQASWMEALPLFFDLHPDERSLENYSLLLSNYVRLRAAFAQVQGDPVTPRP